MHDGRPTSSELAERVQNCSPPRGYEQCPRRHPGHGPRAPFLKWHRDMSQNAPLSVTSLAMLKTETPSVSLVTMLEATAVPAVGAFVADILGDSGWQVESLRKRSSRLSPPDGYWAMYEVSIRKDEEERSLRLVARGAFSRQAWDELSARLVQHSAGPCDPIGGIGFPRLFHKSQHAFWFYPFDPAMPGLPSAADAKTVTDVLLGLGDRAPVDLDGYPKLEIERVRYTPEIGAILRYTLQTSAGPLIVYGKVQPGDRGLRTQRIVEGLWRASAAKPPGLLRLPRPLGWLEHELERLERVAEQFAYVHPEGHFLLSDLTTHLRKRARIAMDEEWLPTHGDLKYDQFVYHDGAFTLLDFDYFAVAETSYDLGKYCGYLVPSAPGSWEDTLAAEKIRTRFLQRYLELRPHATIQRFPIYEALTLGLRAMTFMWAQRSGWQRVAETFLVMAHERLYSRIPETI